MAFTCSSGWEKTPMPASKGRWVLAPRSAHSSWLWVESSQQQDVDWGSRSPHYPQGAEKEKSRKQVRTPLGHSPAATSPGPPPNARQP